MAFKPKLQGYSIINTGHHFGYFGGPGNYFNMINYASTHPAVLELS